jgi:DNA-binding transcriptional ArsR family regulator
VGDTVENQTAGESGEGTDSGGKRLVSDVDTLKAMADPLRMRVLQLLMADYGKAWTTKDIARSVGISPTKLYYHLNLLEARGLIEVRETRMINGIVERHYGSGQRQLSFTHGWTGENARAGAESVGGMVTSVLDQVRDEINDGLRRGAIYPSRDAPEDKRMIVHREVAAITLDRVPELRERISELIGEFVAEGAPTGQGADFGLLVAMHPLVARDSAEEEPGPAGS